VNPAETSPSLAAIVADVDGDLPETRQQTSPDGMMTIAFTDLEGSTELMERIGEEQFLELMLEHNRIVRECVAEHDGDIPKSRGDGFLLIFAHSSAALACAVDLQRALAAYNELHPQQQMRVRVGVHTGNIFQADEDWLGRAVVLAARITGFAHGGEILVSSACREYTLRLGRWEFGRPADMQPKGLSASERVYPLDWQSEAI
jgi:class 3 adenylate cyclase